MTPSRTRKGIGGVGLGAVFALPLLSGCGTPPVAEDQPVRLVWHYLLLDQVRTSTRTPEQLDALRADTISLIDRIRAARSGP